MFYREHIIRKYISQMAKKKAVEAAEVEETTEDVVEEVEEQVSGDSATVSWKGRSRVYTKAVHGKDFRALAKEFAAKVGGKVA